MKFNTKLIITAVSKIYDLLSYIDSIYLLDRICIRFGRLYFGYNCILYRELYCGGSGNTIPMRGRLNFIGILNFDNLNHLRSKKTNYLKNFNENILK